MTKQEVQKWRDKLASCSNTEKGLWDTADIKLKLSQQSAVAGEKKGKSNFLKYCQNVMCKMLEEIIIFYTSPGGPQLDKHILFKALFFRKIIGRTGEKLEVTNKKRSYSTTKHHYCTKNWKSCVSLCWKSVIEEVNMTVVFQNMNDC